ncbi:Aldehyde-activating protein [Sphingobium herbicidovorans NBRC 16415]|uniref:Aldehyde-activating protein n=1 Tax=Sphingobium herbicidovorans (strain ATCC 700291 / DSM 11019 / CCUG 56400 / KCTC 2939 / LMG 18315 / NBRC 16415 / MH) TaxID=1219045 RepID=A0A086P5P4_SPHHM|nr:hypothetical protein [Sphingobium herbicidovorans]KFG88712.1 Aldehyde-activating protein [Sphingobium herbicidovorans NBRC 16415]
MPYTGSCHCGAVTFTVADAPTEAMSCNCNVCGTQSFAEGDSPDGPVLAFNLRCVPEIDIDALKINKVDGASF